MHRAEYARVAAGLTCTALSNEQAHMLLEGWLAQVTQKEAHHSQRLKRKSEASQCANSERSSLRLQLPETSTLGNDLAHEFAVPDC